MALWTDVRRIRVRLYWLGLQELHSELQSSSYAEHACLDLAIGVIF